jgi:hypothetical protein
MKGGESLGLVAQSCAELIPDPFSLILGALVL